MFDFSILKEIDLTNPENIIFLVIFLVIVIFIISVFFAIINKVVKFIKNLMVRLFGLNTRKPKFNKKDSTEWLHQSQINQSVQMGMPKIIPTGEKEVKIPVQIPVPTHSLNVEIGAMGPMNTMGSTAVDHKIPTQKIVENKIEDFSIFKGGDEISKVKLEQELRKNSKIWESQRQVGLTLSPAERADLVKKIFTPAQGRNISKADLRQSVRLLNKKLLGTTNMAEHAKIRKEIKFFKKIGGI